MELEVPGGLDRRGIRDRMKGHDNNRSWWRGCIGRCRLGICSCSRPWLWGGVRGEEVV